MVGMTTQERIAAGRAPGQTWWSAGLSVAAVGWGAQQFAPLLLMYQARLHLSPATIQATFGLYVLGLIPSLLLGGPLSDRVGRRPVAVPALAISIGSTLLLAAGGTGAGWLFAGRLVAGIASGAAFSAGAAWIKELSGGGDGVNHGPRRLTVAMSVGFGIGPLVAGVLAQWAPAPTLIPYLPHLILASAALLLAIRAPETRLPGRRQEANAGPLPPELRSRRFLTVVVPLAPWVFGSAAIALAYLPEVVRTQLGGGALLFSGVITMLSAGSGIAVQPLARRLDLPGRPGLLAAALGTVVVGLLAAAGAAAAAQPALVFPAAVILGAGYGGCQVCGLLEVQRLARPAHLAGLTSVYQAVSYTGYVAPFPLAAASRLLAPPELLLVVAGLAMITLAWTVRQASSAA
jgi:hypothetical protein